LSSSDPPVREPGGTSGPTGSDQLREPGAIVPSPDLTGRPDAAGTPVSPPPSRLGASTFTIEGRSAPALFVVGWLATLIGLGMIAIALMSGDTAAGRVLLFVGLPVLSIGLIAAAGSQGIERRVRGVLPYVGPSPFLVFAAVIPVSIVAGVVVGLPLVALGMALDGPLAALVAVTVQAVVYIWLVRLLVVDTGALSWREMGVLAIDRAAISEIGGGAVWAIPIIALTVIVSEILLAIFPVTPVSPLPPTGEPVGFALSLLAGVIVAPFGEEILFRAFATTAWVRGLGVRRGIIQAALIFAFAHVLTISGGTTGEAFGLAAVGFGSRIPIAIALGLLFVRRRTMWASFGLHAAFNGILLVIAEIAARPL
jgi:membrane protease YdiL (CAAX protease family)